MCQVKNYHACTFVDKPDKVRRKSVSKCVYGTDCLHLSQLLISPHWYSGFFLCRTKTLRSHQKAGFHFTKYGVPSLRWSYLVEGVTQTRAPGVVQCGGSQRGHTTAASLRGARLDLSWTSTESHRRLAAVGCWLSCLR